MPDKLTLQEDDQTRDARFKQELPELKRGIRMALIAPPILVGCMYWFMLDLPKDAFPKDFWATALFLPMLVLSLMLGIPLLQGRCLHRKFTLSATGIRVGAPENRGILWRGLSSWRIEASREHAGYFDVEFCGQRRALKITVRNTYSQEDVRNYVMHAIARAY